MAIAGKQADIVGTYLETVQGGQPLDPLLRRIQVAGPAAPLSEVSSALGVADRDFAQLVEEAERDGLITRERANGRITLSLTRRGLARVDTRQFR